MNKEKEVKPIFSDVDEDGLSVFSPEYMRKHGIEKGYDPRLFGKDNIERLLREAGEDAGIVIYKTKDDPCEILNVNICLHATRFKMNVAELEANEKPVDIVVLDSIEQIMSAIDERHAQDEGCKETPEEMLQLHVRMFLLTHHMMTLTDAQGEYRNIGRDDIMEASVELDKETETKSSSEMGM